jgi:mannosyltransferase OCH1-like enzyme
MVWGAARYVLLHRFGGVYADLDMECLRPLQPLLERHGLQWGGRGGLLHGSVFIGAEPHEHARRQSRRNLLICNGAFGHVCAVCVCTSVCTALMLRRARH